MTPYLQVCSNDPTAALSLYVWNSDVSCALFQLLGVCEVALRNASANQLTLLHADMTGEWFTNPKSLLSDEAMRDIDKAVERLERHRTGAEITAGRVTAELSFGFWAFLLAAQYESTLWTPALCHAFPHLRPQRRKLAQAVVSDLQHMRNRIAHHEPIHNHDLEKVVAKAEQLLCWISTDTHQWACGVHNIREVINLRPC